MNLPEKFSMEFMLFNGNVIKLDADGTFYIDGNKCMGPTYTGVEDC